MNIIDSLVVTIGLDISRFGSSSDQVEQSMGRMKREAIEFTVDEERAVEAVEDGFKKITGQMIKLFFLMLGAGGIASFTEKTTKVEVALSLMSAVLGVPPQQLSAFQLGLGRLGGTASGTAAALGRLNSITQNLRAGLGANVPPEFFALGGGHIDLHANALEQLLQLSRAVQTAPGNYQQKFNQLKTLLGDEYVSREVLKGPQAIQSMMDKTASTAVTTGQMQSGERLYSAWQHAQDAVQAYGRAVLDINVGHLTQYLNLLGSWIEQHLSWPKSVHLTLGKLSLKWGVVGEAEAHEGPAPALVPPHNLGAPRTLRMRGRSHVPRAIIKPASLGSELLPFQSKGELAIATVEGLVSTARPLPTKVTNLRDLAFSYILELALQYGVGWLLFKGVPYQEQKHRWGGAARGQMTKAPETFPGGQPTSTRGLDPQIRQEITEAFKAEGAEDQLPMAFYIAGREGPRSSPTYNEPGDYVGGKPYSFGAFQLHYPGVGAAYTAQTGHWAGDPQYRVEQFRFVAKWVKEHGWAKDWTTYPGSEWARQHGIGMTPLQREYIKEHPVATPTPSPNTSSEGTSPTAPTPNNFTPVPRFKIIDPSGLHTYPAPGEKSSAVPLIPKPAVEKAVTQQSSIIKRNEFNVAHLQVHSNSVTAVGMAKDIRIALQRELEQNLVSV